MRTEEIRIRDPFVYLENGTYYLYSNHYDENGHGSIVAYTGSDLENWSEPKTVFAPGPDFWGKTDFWAPEMHAYKGKYYLFASFIAPGRNRATAILKADSPLGPFTPWGEDQITPRDWMCLDGTLYVDGDDHPYMVFCHEWVQIQNGAMCAVPLKDDLSGPAGEVHHLFFAGDAKWVSSVKGEGNFVTDGPFLYTAPNGSLCMLWSSFLPHGRYAVGRAVSASGSVFGPWALDEEPVYPNEGGHCMLFTGKDGVRRMSLHRPNASPLERAQFLPVRMDEEGGLTFL